MNNKYYIIIFAMFVAIMGLLFAVNTHFLNLQKYGLSVTKGIVLGIITLLFWSQFVWIMGKRRLPEKKGENDYFEPTTKNVKVLCAFVISIIAIVVVWTLYVLRFEY